ncbi:B-type cyclin [Elasticomyces elasticus]|nr:B-type cyclin [Elasticomyces elasticus]KAK5735811.1 B-type cyclin [Elasticomyces elasticus]
MDQQPVEQFHDILEDEDYCEDGYSTAKSFRLCSVSTCTATTVLAHMYRNKLRGKRGDATVFIDITRVPQDAKDEHWNIPIMAEYGDEILDFMRDLEARMVLNPRYMDQQIELQWSMRAILVDWVIRVHGRVNLLPETLFLAVNYVDHFLSCHLYGCGDFTAADLLKAERYMLRILQFELGWPGPISFLRRISTADAFNVEIWSLANIS